MGGFEGVSSSGRCTRKRRVLGVCVCVSSVDLGGFLVLFSLPFSLCVSECVGRDLKVLVFLPLMAGHGGGGGLGFRPQDMGSLSGDGREVAGGELMV